VRFAHFFERQRPPVRFGLPSFTERLEDIPLLVHYFLKKYNDVYEKNISGADAAGADCAPATCLAGNVRELENVIATAVITAIGDFIDLAALEHSQHQGPRSPQGGFRRLVPVGRCNQPHVDLPHFRRPTRWISRFWITRSSLACISSDVSPISEIISNRVNLRTRPGANPLCTQAALPNGHTRKLSCDFHFGPQCHFGAELRRSTCHANGISPPCDTGSG
jgi:hypothetical protein